MIMVLPQVRLVIRSRIWSRGAALAGSASRDVIYTAVAGGAGRPSVWAAKLPPHVIVYFAMAMAMALFADDDYDEVMALLSETLPGWGSWDEDWTVPTSGGITQARARLGAGRWSRCSTPSRSPWPRSWLEGLDTADTSVGLLTLDRCQSRVGQGTGPARRRSCGCPQPRPRTAAQGRVRRPRPPPRHGRWCRC